MVIRQRSRNDRIKFTRCACAVIRDKFGGTERLRALMSPSVTQLVKNKETVAEAEEKARETFERRLTHELQHVGKW